MLINHVYFSVVVHNDKGVGEVAHNLANIEVLLLKQLLIFGENFPWPGSAILG